MGLDVLCSKLRPNVAWVRKERQEASIGHERLRTRLVAGFGVEGFFARLVLAQYTTGLFCKVLPFKGQWPNTAHAS